MIPELNLWSSNYNGALNGYIVDKTNQQTQQVIDKVTRLLPLDKFIEYSLKKNKFNDKQIAFFSTLNSSTSTFGWSKNDVLVELAANHSNAYLWFPDNNIVQLPRGVRTRQYEGTPPLWFRSE